MDINDIKVSDDVAYNILHPFEKKNRLFAILLLIFLIVLILLISFVCFSMANYYKTIKNNTIVTGSIVYSFNDNSSYINIDNAYPMSDDVGKRLTDVNQYYDFSISVKFADVNVDNMTNYEISILPDSNNTIYEKYIKIYLEKNGLPVLINGKEVNFFSELRKSDIRDNAFVLLDQNVNRNTLDSYVFRMWLSNDYKIDDVKKIFKCRIGVDSY